jgi:GNAT superfamily N-acetyltransferase
MTITYRKVQPQDAEKLAHLIRSIGFFKTFTELSLEEAVSSVRRQINHCLADNSHTIYVAEDGPDSLLGFISVHWEPYLIHTGLDGYISELFIEDKSRSQGIGAKLLEIVIEEGRERGCVRLMLLNPKTRESYARGFYTKHGWQEWDDAAIFVFRP